MGKFGSSLLLLTIVLAFITGCNKTEAAITVDGKYWESTVSVTEKYMVMVLRCQTAGKTTTCLPTSQWNTRTICSDSISGTEKEIEFSTECDKNISPDVEIDKTVNYYIRYHSEDNQDQGIAIGKADVEIYDRMIIGKSYLVVKTKNNIYEIK